jgi:tRNA(Ile)-lysidine synthase
VTSSASPDFHPFDSLADEGPVVAVAVSGGSDSLALLMLAHRWAAARGRIVMAATVDHGLRPEAAHEAAGVGRLCSGMGVAHTVLRWTPPERRIAQAAARRARHALLATWARSVGAGVIAIGHTRDDRIETFLIRARAGSHWRGLAGPLPRSASPAWPEGAGLRLVRPLLGLRRESLRDGLRREGVSWIDDPSNDDPRHERVRIRNLLARTAPETGDRIVRIMDGLARLRVAATAEARAALASVSAADDTLHIPAEVVAALGHQARLRLVEALVLAAGGAEGRPETARLETLASKLAARDALGGGATLGGCWVRENRGRFSFAPAPPRAGHAPRPVLVNLGRAEALLCDPGLASLAGEAAPPPPPARSSAGEDWLPAGKSASMTQ